MHFSQIIKYQEWFINILIERNYENIYRKLNLLYYIFLLRFKIKSPLLSFKI